MTSKVDPSVSHTTGQSSISTPRPKPPTPSNPTSVRDNAVSSTNPPAPPRPPPTGTPAPSPNSTRSDAGLTTHVVTTVSVPQNTLTVLRAPNSTLSDPVALTLNINGSNVTTTPPLITMTSTATDSNGAWSTVTQVVANPPPVEQNGDSKSGILQNSGALAGIFIAIGIIVATMIIGIVWLVRRSRRRARRARWLTSIQRTGPASPGHNPFQDPLESPSMRVINTNDTYDWSGAGNTRDMHSDEKVNYDRTSSTGHGHAHSPLFPDTYPILHNPSYPRPPEQFVLRTMNMQPNYLAPEGPPRAQFSRSIAPSTPSEYPASLPDEDDDQAHHGPMQMTTGNRSSIEPVTTPPPRPPRSLLRENSKIMQYKPPTPPDSIANSSTHNSPISEARPEDIFNRRTLLGVRNRAVA